MPEKQSCQGYSYMVKKCFVLGKLHHPLTIKPNSTRLTSTNASTLVSSKTTLPVCDHTFSPLSTPTGHLNVALASDFLPWPSSYSHYPHPEEANNPHCRFNKAFPQKSSRNSNFFSLSFWQTTTPGPPTDQLQDQTDWPVMLWKLSLFSSVLSCPMGTAFLAYY